MATSGSKSIAATSHDTLKFSWSESSQSVENNNTKITWKMELIADANGRISSTASKDWSVTVNGTKYSGTNTIGISNNATITLANGTTTISHNADGTKTFSYSFSQEFDITFSGSKIGTKSGSGSGTLDTIPRKSTLTVANGTLGTAQSLAITEHESTFKHKLAYSCGGVSGWILGDSSSFSTANSVEWTPPLSLASENTTGTSVSIKFVLHTYANDGTYIGNNSYTKTFSIPSSVKPSCSVSVTDSMGYADRYGSFLKGLSKLKVVVTATTSYGSAIASYSTTANGATYTVASFTTGVLGSSGSMTVNATVKDKRGRSGSASKSINVLNYNSPNISELSVKRCDSNGTENIQGEHVKVIFSALVTSLNRENSATYVLQYKKTSQTSFPDSQTITLTEFSDNYAPAEEVYIFKADSGSSYDVKLSVIDDFGTVSKTTVVSTAFSLMHWHKSGKGLAIGKLSEFTDVFDIGFQARFSGGIMNIVAEKVSDLNELKTPNTYVTVNQGASSYANIPEGLTGTFTIEVMSAGAEGQLIQRITSCDKVKPKIYIRHYYQATWGGWHLIYEGDTGWQNLILQSGISVGSECGYLKGRIKNGVLYIKGDVKGIDANWKYFAQLPDTLLPANLPSATRFGGVYYLTYFCAFNLQNTGRLYVASNSSGSWDATKDVHINTSICL